MRADSATPVRRLDEELLARGVEELIARDADLAAVVERCGPPPLWSRPPGFATLVRIVLEQQVSLVSARAVYERLEASLGGVSPERLAAVGERGLRQHGLTRQKASYCHGIATAVHTGRLDLAAVARLDDEAAHEALTALRGIGPWTAAIYLLMALGRPDVWPLGDLALVKAVQQVKALDTPPDRDGFLRLGDPWRPWRAVAARILWQHYLHGGGDA